MKISILEEEIKFLKKQIAEIFHDLKFESDDTTLHIKRLYNSIEKVNDYLTPLLHKVFPGIAEGEREIEAFLKNYRKSPPNDKGS